MASISMAPPPTQGINAIARSATLVALLGFQDKALSIREKTGVDSEVGDFPVLAAVFRDIYPIVRSTDIPLSKSATLALEECRRSQEKLMQVLRSTGFTERKHSGRLLDRILYSVKRYFNSKTLEQAKLNYRNSVFLLRDITMDAVTHYHLEHMRHELDDLCGGSDQSRVHISLPPTPTTPSIQRTKKDDADNHNWVKANKDMLSFMATALVETTLEGSRDEGTVASRQVDVRGLYDTGSDKNIISRSFLKKHKVPESDIQNLPRAETLKGVGKMEMKVYHKITLKWFLDGDAVFNDEFFVIDDDDDTYDILLGWDFILENDMIAMKKPAIQKRGIRVRKVVADGTATERKLKVKNLQREALEEEEDPRQQALRDYHNRKAMQGNSGTASTATTTVNSPELQYHPNLGVYHNVQARQTGTELVSSVPTRPNSNKPSP